MQAAEELDDSSTDVHLYDDGGAICRLCDTLRGNSIPCTTRRAAAEREWLRARNQAVESVRRLQAIGLHKQIANRLLEPFLWHTVIVTATEWENFFALRCHKDAQPEIRVIAEMMRGLYSEGKPRVVGYGEWHLPLVEGVDKEELIADVVDRTDQPREEVNDVLAQVSSGRCARVSYLTHDGKRDWRADVAFAERLRASGHMSPFEHAARPMSLTEKQASLKPVLATGLPHAFFGNFRGWVQYRKLLPNEAVFRGV